MTIHAIISSACLVLVASTLVLSEPIYHLDRSLTYRLHNPFSRNWTSQTLEPSSFFSTNVANSTLQDRFNAGQNATFISLSDEFDDLFGENPEAVMVANNTLPIFFEAGIWVPGNGTKGENGSVWFTADTEAVNNTTSEIPKVHIFDLSNNKVIRPNLSHNLIYPNGGTLYGSRDDHSVLLTTFGSEDVSGSIVIVDTNTFQVKTLVNSYWGYRLNSPDDVAFATFDQGHVVYFTDTTFAAQFGYSGTPQLSNAVWRFDVDTGMLINAISAEDIPNANGVRLNKEGTKLYVTDSSGSLISQKGNVTASSNIYVYDLDQSGTPMNKRVFGTSIHALLTPDGIKVDDDGRVWTGESGGIVIRSSQGKLLGFINAVPLLAQPNFKLKIPDIANFALAGDEIIIGANFYVYRIKLNRQIVSPDRVGGA